MIKDAIKKVVNKEDLEYNEAYAVMNEIMSGETSAVENAAYLAALSTKSSGMETIAEISGSAAAMREHAERVEHDMEVIDIVGTGGDHSGSINVSTTASFLAAAAGLKVCKHGNRAASSWSGTADCLEALGVNIDQPPAKVREELSAVGMAFLFAQRYHQSMQSAASSASARYSTSWDRLRIHRALPICCSASTASISCARLPGYCRGSG